MSEVMLELDHVVREFVTRSPAGRRVTRAVDDVSFELRRGEALGLVGESGSGKSTTARLALRLIEPTSGTVRFEGDDVAKMHGRALLRFRSQAQLVFQDPYSALDPRMSVGDIIAEGIRIHRPRVRTPQLREEVGGLLELVGLRADHLTRRPAAFSGGERQRIGIARALAVRPRLLVCDEPVASLDVSIQAQILNLLRDLRSQLDLTILFIAHDLATVRYLCDRIAVMQEGQIKEIGDRDQIYDKPQAEYTRSLIAAVPEPDPITEREKVAIRRQQFVENRELTAADRTSDGTT